MKVIDIVRKCMNENRSMSFEKLKTHPIMNKEVVIDENNG